MNTQQLVYDNIINKSSSLFITYGFRNITMDDISIECGISKKTIYHFFENKDELVKKVIENELETFGNALKAIKEKAKDAIDELMQLLPLIHNMAKRIQPNMNNELARFFPASHQQIEAFRKDELLLFHISNLERGIQEGLYLECFNKEVIAGMRVQQLNDIISKTINNHSEVNIEEISKQLNGHYISGLSTPKGFELLKKYTYQHNK